MNETCSDYWPGIVSSIGNNQQENRWHLCVKDVQGSLSLRS
ncbi:hypothetical protein ACULNC_06585 [Shigella flexneri]